MSRMSQDRVHFTVKSRYLERATIRECLLEVFGVQVKPARVKSTFAEPYDDLHLICRPSQFARFVILRHVKYGEPNNMACLNMKLVMPEPETKVLDVSTNPNTVHKTFDN